MSRTSGQSPSVIVSISNDIVLSVGPTFANEPRPENSPAASAPFACWAAWSLQPLGTINLAQAAVKGTEWSVPGLPSDFRHEAIGESDLGILAKLRDSGGDDLSVLYRQVFVA